jgi:hypothetical protein
VGWIKVLVSVLTLIAGYLTGHLVDSAALMAVVQSVISAVGLMKSQDAQPNGTGAATDVKSNPPVTGGASGRIRVAMFPVMFLTGLALLLSVSCATTSVTVTDPVSHEVTTTTTKALDTAAISALETAALTGLPVFETAYKDVLTWQAALKSAQTSAQQSHDAAMLSSAIQVLKSLTAGVGK